MKSGLALIAVLCVAGVILPCFEANEDLHATRKLKKVDSTTEFETGTGLAESVEEPARGGPVSRKLLQVATSSARASASGDARSSASSSARVNQNGAVRTNTRVNARANGDGSTANARANARASANGGGGGGGFGVFPFGFFFG